MHNDERKRLPTSARYAAAAAIAAWPLGFLLGGMLSSGQDAAGEGIAWAIGVAIGALASILFGLVHWYCRKQRRIAILKRHRRPILMLAGVSMAVFVAWYVQPSFEDQRYSVRVKNWSSRDMLDIEVRFAHMTVPIRELKAGAEFQTHGFSKKPFGIVQASWVDDAGEKQNVADRYGIGAPRRFDGGTVVIRIFSEHQLSAGFLPAYAEDTVND